MAVPRFDATTGQIADAASVSIAAILSPGFTISLMPKIYAMGGISLEVFSSGFGG
jgi:hypothetical protein